MSNSPKQLPDGAPFGHQQKVALEAILPTLTAPQSAWLSGFFAGMGQLQGAQPGSAPVPVATQALSSAVPLTILFGTESGNAENCAQDLAVVAKAAGFAPKVVDMGDYSKDKLASEKNLMVVVSTWGEGDPPERAADFYEFVLSDKAPKLEGVSFSVFALGDTSYADFCACGIAFDKRFEELGAKRFYDRADADVDFDGVFSKWKEGSVKALAEATGAGKSSSEVPVVTTVETAPAESVPAASIEPFGKKNPFPSLLKEKINLNGNGSAKETFHLEFDLAGSGLTYKPGDVIGLFPENCPDVVDETLRALGFRGDEIVEEGTETYTLSEYFEERFDLTSLNTSFMGKYGAVAKNDELEAFLAPENKPKVSEWIQGRELRDLFEAYPANEQLTVSQVTGILRKMPPRLYSIASSLSAHPDEVHLTVGTVRYETHGRARKGVCSTFLGDRLEVGETARLYTHTNKNFFLPADSETPIIMVGPGTGIAPFRSFVEERAAIGANGQNWLFFGDQHFATDFLYQTEWQKAMKSGILNRMDVAFSRDTDKKVYVQHRMKEQAKDLYSWLEEGAYFYVCGDASRMAKDVHQALIEIAIEVGGKSEDDATAWVKQLQKDKRYQRDVY